MHARAKQIYDVKMKLIIETDKDNVMYDLIGLNKATLDQKSRIILIMEKLKQELIESFDFDVEIDEK